MTSDDEMSAADETLMRALAEAVGGIVPPAGLVERAEGLIGWLDVDVELAELLEASTGELAGTRGDAEAPSTMEFAITDGSFVIELDISDDRLRGQVLGADVQQLVLRTPSGDSTSIIVDELGRFTIENPPPGTARLEVGLTGQRHVRTDWFVI